MKKYYKILGLKEGATKQDIKKAFNKLLKELDPKKNDDQDFFIEETKKLKEAYERLTNISILSTVEIRNKSNLKGDQATNETNNIPPKLFKKKKSFFSKENIILVLLVILLGHSFYIQILVTKTSDYARSAKNYARDAASSASDASDNSQDAASYASDASNNAQDAASYASDASDYAERAMNYSFGYSCSSCP